LNAFVSFAISFFSNVSDMATLFSWITWWGTITPAGKGAEKCNYLMAALSPVLNNITLTC